MVGYYFERRRGIAAGVACSGSGFGLLALAPLAAFLVAEYTWKGALTVLAGVSLNCLVWGALMRPLPAPSSVVDIGESKDTVTPIRVSSRVAGAPLASIFALSNSVPMYLFICLSVCLSGYLISIYVCAQDLLVRLGCRSQQTKNSVRYTPVGHTVPSRLKHRQRNLSILCGCHFMYLPP